MKFDLIIQVFVLDGQTHSPKRWQQRVLQKNSHIIYFIFFLQQPTRALPFHYQEGK
jgi:hypothetical protein